VSAAGDSEQDLIALPSALAVARRGASPLTPEGKMSVDIKKSLKKFLPYLLKAQEDNLSEADTTLRILKVFEETLGYDPLGDITKEWPVHDKFVDIALKIDGNIRFLVEVKSAGTKLHDRQIDQAKHYGAEGNIPWVVLTNGVVWILYHLSFDEGVEYVRAFSVDLASDSIDTAADQLAHLHKHSIMKGELEDYWQKRSALRPESIGRAIFAEDTLKVIRREIHHHDEILIDEEDLARAIHEMFSRETRDVVPLKIRRKSHSRGHAGGPKAAAANPPAVAEAPSPKVACEGSRQAAAGATDAATPAPGTPPGPRG
jgi:predicted type IV restriction endonuclease